MEVKAVFYVIAQPWIETEDDKQAGSGFHCLDYDGWNVSIIRNAEHFPNKHEAEAVLKSRIDNAKVEKEYWEGQPTPHEQDLINGKYAVYRVKATYEFTNGGAQ